MSKRADIDRLALMLEGDRHATAEAAEDELELGGLATLLRQAQPTVEPMRPEFRAQLRAEVVQAARDRVAEPALLTRMRDRVQRFKYSTGLATATGLASVSLAGGGVAGAAEYAEPGDLLYPAKLAIEDARLFIDTDAATQGRRALSYAAERMDEAAAAAERGDMDGAEAALQSAADRTREGRESIDASGDDTATLDLFDALTAQAEALAALTPQLSGGAAAAADQVGDEIRAGLEDAARVLSIPPAQPDPEPDVEPDAPVAPAPESPSDEDPPAAPAVPDTPQAPTIDPPTSDGGTTPDGPDTSPVLPPIEVPDVELPPVPVPEGSSDLPLPDGSSSILPPPADVESQGDTLLEDVEDTAGGAIDAVTGGLASEGQQ